MKRVRMTKSQGWAVLYYPDNVTGAGVPQGTKPPPAQPAAPPRESDNLILGGGCSC